MKKITTILFLSTILFIGWKFLNQKTDNIEEIKRPEYSNTPSIKPSLVSKLLAENLELQYGGKKIAVAWIKIKEPQKISLFLNLEEKKSAREFMEKNSCQSIINGGFYDKNNNPLGLLIINGSIVSPKIESNFLNGIFSITQDKKVSISRELSNQNIFLALQSGPLLYENGEPFILKIIDDKESRRMVIAVNKESEIFFIVFYDRQSPLQGPLLADLPQLLKLLEAKIDEKFEIALNLDGGSASVFYSKDLSLSELSPVGSFFCITK